MSTEFAWLRAAFGNQGDARELFALAREQERAGNLRVAATAYDRAFGLQPEDEEVRQARAALLDRLSIAELGLRFRYIPAGAFLMGSETGDPDEQPVHPVELSEFWIAETPLSWVDYCRLMGWSPPPEGMPSGLDWQTLNKEDPEETRRFWEIHIGKQLRFQYCEGSTLRATHDWHSHIPIGEWIRWGNPEAARDRFGWPEREDPQRPYTYEEKPMVCVSWQAIQELCERISTVEVVYRLPTEAEWEKAARGGLIGCRYPWGSDPPSAERCDCNRFEQFAIQPVRRFLPNGYGLYAMSGGVWEWTSDWYDARSYAESPPSNPPGPPQGEERVLRGGSWADCADAVTVSFRMSRRPEGFGTPNVGFRLCRVERRPES